MNKRQLIKSSYAIALMLLMFIQHTIGSALSDLGIHVVPYPQEVLLGGEAFTVGGQVHIVLDKNATQSDRFAAGQLQTYLTEKWNIKAIIGTSAGSKSIVLTRKAKQGKEQGYTIETTAQTLTVRAKDEAGLYYGVQTLKELIVQERDHLKVPGMKITDWPDVKVRAAHYDTKHHQDKGSYVKAFIDDLSRYKINMLVWEWEDKLAYQSHPEIGAPGAFTIAEMQEFTRYARERHVELVPLVQGLGHVSFILKWQQHKHLREVADSDWEFCPLKEGVYDLLFDLWDEAIEATPGSKYIHIGSDETFELGLCEQCQEKAKEIGNSGLYHTFAAKAAKHLKKRRKVMLWERPMGWEMNRSPIKAMKPDPDLVLTESYNYETPDFKYANQAKMEGYEVYIYDPNPGLEPLFLPYDLRQFATRQATGSLKDSYDLLSVASKTGIFDGMINTSWDDSGLHNQMWMLSFVASAQYSWNGAAPGIEELKEAFFDTYYGKEAFAMAELYYLLNEGAYYYKQTLERDVWHHGEIGKTHIPDMPRGQYIEYDPYWNSEYKPIVKRSRKISEKMMRARQIIEANKRLQLDHAYDFEVYESIARLISHTCQTYKDLSDLEYTLTRAHKAAFNNRKGALSSLKEAYAIVDGSIKRRNEVYNSLVNTWEKTRLPKGYSTPDKKYFFKMDRSRHYANRTPDMRYLVYDEDLLDMETYRDKLKTYIDNFQLDF